MYYVLTYIDENDQLRRQRYEDEDSARRGWYNQQNSLKLEEVQVLESNLRN